MKTQEIIEIIAESSFYGLSDSIGSVDSLISNSRTSIKQVNKLLAQRYTKTLLDKLLVLPNMIVKLGKQFT